MEAAVVKQVETPLIAPLLIPAGGVARLLSVSLRQVWSMHQIGTLGPLPVKLGARTLWKDAELREWVEADCPHRERWLDLKKCHKNSVR